MVALAVVAALSLSSCSTTTEAADAATSTSNAGAGSSDNPPAAPSTHATDTTDATTATADAGIPTEPAAPAMNLDGAVDLTGPGSASTADAIALVPVAAGDSGDDVVALQQRLDRWGFAPGTADGSYGRRTERSVSAFQQVVGLEPTGEADAATIAALLHYRYDGLLLRRGDEDDDVLALQGRLADGPFDPGPLDGVYGTATTESVWALEKLAGIPVDGNWGPLDEKAWAELADNEIGRPAESHDVRWVEVDLSEQLMKVYDPGVATPVLISHISSGSGRAWENDDHSGSSITPLGHFTITRRISGWRESSLDIGRLYNPLYFNGGIALHGAGSVPLYPASHGCIRVPMHIADYLPSVLPNGTPVDVLS